MERLVVPLINENLSRRCLIILAFDRVLYEVRGAAKRGYDC